MDERTAFLEDIVAENCEKILGGGPGREKRRVERHDDVLDGNGFRYVLDGTSFDEGMVFYPLHNRYLCLVFPRHETAVVCDCRENVMENTVFVVGFVMNTVVMEEFLGGGNVKIAVVIEERFDESTVFDGELFGANDPLLVMEGHGIEDIGQLVTNVVSETGCHIGVGGIFLPKLLNYCEFVCGLLVHLAYTGVDFISFSQGTYGSPNPSLSENLRFPEPLPYSGHTYRGRGSGNRRFPDSLRKLK
jgi:hypothetical protein